MKLLAAIGFAFLLAACNPGGQPASKAPQRPPPAVGVITLESRDVPISSDLPGRIAPHRIAEVRPRVSGIVIERVFTQGSFVKQGDVLYRIDPEPLRVQFERASATLKRAEAARLFALQQANRQEELRKREVGTRQQFESAAATLAQADADVAAARANLAAAEIDLEYSQVRAPISGRIGRALITEGALVGVNNTGPMATIQQLDPVYADVTQSAGELLALRRALNEGVIKSKAGEARARLYFDNGAEYEHPGRLLFSEAAVDETTGQVTLRGEFPNPERILLPGLYVRVRIEEGVKPNAITIPQQAVQRDAGGRSNVYVVTRDNTAELRPVVLSRAIGDSWLVESGLASGERIVIEGFQRIRPGVPVHPQPWTPAGSGNRSQSVQSGEGK